MGKGGKGGKSGLAKGLGLAGALAGGFAPWIFGLKAGAGLAGAIYGLSLGQTIGAALSQTKESTTTSSFDAKMNSVDQDARIPLVYGTRKIGGQQSYHLTNTSDKWLVKDVIVGEGQFSGGYGITANGFALKINGNLSTYIRAYNSATNYTVKNVTSSDNPIFGLINWKYQDAECWVSDSYLHLYANGVDKSIHLQSDSDLKSDSSNDFSCSMSLLFQYIEGIHYDTTFAADGWQVVNPVIVSDSPNRISSTDRTGCYKTPVTFWISKYNTGDSWVQFYDGTQSRPDYYLKTGSYTNMAYLHSYLKYTDKLGSGNPTLTMIAHGRKVYDTRTKEWKYSENPAMIVRDYLINKTFGSGYFIDSSMLDEDSFIETANYCDEIITSTDGSGRSITEPRYRLNIVFNDKKTYLQHLQDMLACFAGFIVFSNGKVSLKIEKSESSVYSFTDDNIVQGSLSYKADSTADSPNKYVMKYIEPVLDWTSVGAYVEDLVGQHNQPIGRGKVISKDVELTGVTSQSQALRLGKIYRDIVRLCPITVSFKTGMQGMHLEPGDVVKISKNMIVDGEVVELFKDMPVRILEIHDDNGVFSLTCRQYNPSIYDDSLGGNLKVHSYVGDTKEENVLPIAVPQVENLNLYTIYRQQADGNIGYDVVVSYELPDGFSLETGLVYYKTNHVDTTETGIISEEILGDEIGFDTDWKYAGDSSYKVVINGAKIGDVYKVKVRARNTKGDLSSDASAVTGTIKVAIKDTVPNTPQNFKYDFTNGFNFSWDDVTNSDIDFYELRLDDKCGTIGNGLLARCTGTSCSTTLADRKATVYLFAHNASKSYSYPAKVAYNVFKPIAPILKIDNLLRGINVTSDAFPNNVSSMNLYISGENYNEMISLPTNAYQFYHDPGLYSFECAFVDLFGEGYRSMSCTGTINPTIDSGWIADESIAVEKVNSTIKTALDAGTYSKEAVTNIVANLNDTDPSKSVYSSITQLSNDINLRVEKGDVINQINLTPEGTTIDGKYLHVTGLTTFDNDVIIAGMIKAGAISADKLATGNITLGENTVSGFIGGTVTLDKNGLTETNSNGSSITFGSEGMVYKDSSGNIFNMVGKQIIGVAKNGDTVKFSYTWDEVPNVVIIPQNMVVSSPSYSESTITLHAFADNITKDGFKVNCYSGISNGSGMFVRNTIETYNYDFVFRQTQTLDTKTLSQTITTPSNVSTMTVKGYVKVDATGFGHINKGSDSLVLSTGSSTIYSGITGFGSTLIHCGEYYQLSNDPGVSATRSSSSSITKEYSFTVNVSPNTTYNLGATFNNLSADYESSGYGTIKCTFSFCVSSITYNISGEQVLDSNGTAIFIVTDTSNANYTIE